MVSGGSSGVHSERPRKCKTWKNEADWPCSVDKFYFPVILTTCLNHAFEAERFETVPQFASEL